MALRLRPLISVVAVNPSAHFREALSINAGLQHPPVRVVQADGAEVGARTPVAGGIFQLAAAVASTVTTGRAGRATIGDEYGDSIKLVRHGEPPRGSVPLLSLRQAVARCHSSAVHVAMFDVQGEEVHIFEGEDTAMLLREYRIERLMIGIHGSSQQDVKGKQRVRDRVVTTLKGAEYTILFERLVFADQPDGLVIAVAPNLQLGYYVEELAAGILPGNT